MIIPQPLPDIDVFKYLMIAGGGFAKKDSKPMDNTKLEEELGEITFLNSGKPLSKGSKIKIVPPDWEDTSLHIKFWDANPDPAYGGDPSIEEVQQKEIDGKIKAYYTNIHTHWIDLNIYVNIIEIPEGAKHIKITVENPNRTYISLNIAEIIPITKKECAKIKKALKEEIQSPTLKDPKHDDYTKVKPLLELYQRLRNKKPPTDADKRKLWSCARECIIGKHIYTASKLIKYALILETNLDDTKKKILEELMSTLKKKAETEELENQSRFKDVVQSCVLLSHFHGVNAKFDDLHEKEWKKKGAECMEKADKMIEEKVDDVDFYKELMNLQWRCYASAIKQYNAVSDFKKAWELRAKLNEVFERITERHPFTSPIIDNVFGNYKETTNLIKKCWDDSHGDKCRE